MSGSNGRSLPDIFYYQPLYFIGCTNKKGGRGWCGLISGGSGLDFFLVHVGNGVNGLIEMCSSYPCHW